MIPIVKANLGAMLLVAHAEKIRTTTPVTLASAIERVIACIFCAYSLAQEKALLKALLRLRITEKDFQWVPHPKLVFFFNFSFLNYSP